MIAARIHPFQQCCEVRKEVLEDQNKLGRLAVRETPTCFPPTETSPDRT